MNKLEFFAACPLKTADYELPNGQKVPVRELTAAERGKLRSIVAENGGDRGRGNACVVAMGCSLFDDADIDDLMGLPGTVITGMADRILELSGLAESAGQDSKNG